jgi:hypothetical protein
MTTPLFQDFDPRAIKWQWDATVFEREFDYHSGALELFYSGGVGSAKTIDHIHMLVMDMVRQPYSRALMVRRALKDLKRTSWVELLQHMADIPEAIESIHKTDMKITFKNGSEIFGDSYDDGDLNKFQSLALSHLDIEEANEMPKEVYQALKLRVGRAGVYKNRIQARCNPDEPGHWLHKYFIEDFEHPNKKVFYSITEQNPFLPRWYLENLKRDLSPLMARRKLMGEWLSVAGDSIYYNYASDRNFKRGEVFEFNSKYPIAIGHDFNIGEGKPMSAFVGQFYDNAWHIKKTYLLFRSNTHQILDEMADDGVFENKTTFKIYGDATGRHSDTRSNQSDWDIIEDFLGHYKRKDGSTLEFSIDVPRSNPPIRRRHNRMNAKFLNANNQVGFYIYSEAYDADEGFRLTKLKKGSGLIEDDGPLCPWQHCTTAIGYAVDYVEEYETAAVGVATFY